MNPFRQAVLAALIAAWGCAAVGCDLDQKVEHPDGEDAWQMAHDVETSEEDVVATVDGTPITRADVEAAWRDRPEMSVREVLDELVDRELLAQRARQEGLHRRPEVTFARKQGLVSALLTEEVEAEAEPDESQRDQLLERVHERRRTPAGLRASHLVVVVPDELEGEDGETRSVDGAERDEMYERARQWVEEAERRLGERPDDDALRRVADELNRSVLPDEYEAVIDVHMRFPRAGQEFGREQVPDGWRPVVEEFARGAEAVAGEEERGTLSDPVRSEFGWHLIKVHDAIPERPVDPDAARAHAGYQLEAAARSDLLREKMTEWVEGRRAELYPERLGSVYDQAGE